jgi:hypothetical protein
MARHAGTTGSLVADKRAHTAKASAEQSLSLPADVAKLLGLPVAGVSKTKNFGEFDWNIGGVPKAVTMTNVSLTVIEFPQPQQPTLAIHSFSFSYSVTTTKWRSGVKLEEIGPPRLEFHFVDSSGGVILATPIFTGGVGPLPGVRNGYWPACIVNCGDSNASQVQTFSLSNDQQWLSLLDDIIWIDSSGTFYPC